MGCPRQRQLRYILRMYRGLLFARESASSFVSGAGAGPGGVSDGGSARGACAAAAVLRGHARGPGARAQRRALGLERTLAPGALLRNSPTELSVGSNGGGRVIAQELRNKSQSCWFGNLQGQPKSHQPFTSFEPETLPSSCVACTQCLWGRHTREQATQTQ